MKYLKLYEAFKSKGISQTLKFINDKVSKTSADNFLNSLKELMSVVNYPIDKISDSDIKYLNAAKALDIKCEKEIKNNYGVFVIKYWFSIEKGFLGFTATGDKEEDIDKDDHDGKRKAELFSESDLDYIKNNIEKNGEIWPVTEYRELKTGDIVIGKFDSNLRGIAMAKIFIDEGSNRRTFAIQSVSAGSTPDDNSWTRYTQFGDLSWWLYDTGQMGGDHKQLHYWRESDEELHYIESPVKNEVEEQKERIKNPLEWNLPLNNRFVMSAWNRTSFSIGSKDDLKSADFALVLYFDDLINSDFDTTVDTKGKRLVQKVGATSLMSDSQIKKMNIQRYIQKLSANLNISDTEFSDLNKIVSKYLPQEFSYFSIYMQRPNWNDISNFTDILYKLISEEDDKEYYIERVKTLYKSLTTNYYEYLLSYQDAKTHIKGNSNLKKIFDELFKLGNAITKHFTKMEINSIDDLWLVNRRIESLYNYMRQSRNQLSGIVREVGINGFRYPSEIERYFKEYENEYLDRIYKEDLERIDRIQKILTSL